jgi:uncharacterized protein
LYRSASSSGALRAEHPILAPRRFLAAKAYFRKHADHGYPFTDCTSFVLMRELDMTAALTTDRHFIEAGFEVLLPTT